MKFLTDKLCEMAGWKAGDHVRVRVTMFGVQVLAMELVIEEVS